MPPSHFCECQYHGCYELVDPKTGKRGRNLPIRTFNTHQSNEAAASLEHRAREAQNAALKLQEDAIANAFAKLNISPDQPVLQRVAKYKADHKKTLIAQISEWQDEINALTNEVDTITFPASMVSRSQFRQAVAQCNRLQESTGCIASHLHNAYHGSLRKEPSIRTLLDDTHMLLLQLIARIDVIEQKWASLNERREADESDAIQNGYAFDSRSHFASILGDMPGVIQLVSLMVVVCHVLLGFSRRGCQWLFSMSARIVEATLTHNSITKRILPYFGDTLRLFPKDVRTVTESFRLEGKSVIYAVCTKCHACHKPSGEEDVPVYPHRCNSSRYRNRCGEILVRPKRFGKHQTFVPIKPYVVFDFRDWLARLLSRKGYEERMDAAWRKMESADDGRMDDIFQGSVIRDFMGPDGKTHFSQAGPDSQTARYLFSMGCDFFNPLRNLANGKKVSIGVIALVCVNLPIAVRYRPENIFLAGIIPGPKEPSLDTINPYFGPLVEVFLQFWRGIWFTKTSLFECGRWILCAIIAVICDMPAGRKVGGFSASSHEYFCSVCWCNLTEHGYNNSDYPAWTWRTNHSCREWAEKFRQAATPRDAASFFDRSGLRCSELLFLPYFNPTKHLVIDPMHNLFLGLIKEHFQNILGYLPKGSKPKGQRSSGGPFTPVSIASAPSNPLPQDPKIKKSIRKLARMLQAPFQHDPTDRQGHQETLKRFKSSMHMTALVYVARALDCVDYPLQADGRNPLDPTSRRLQKGDIASLLIDWKMQQEPTISPICRKHGFVFKDDEIQELWNDIRNTIKPSWATQIPDNISSAGAKLKSDQWRSIGALYLPITLIRIWSKPVVEDEKGNQERRDLLHLTMLLCSAVCVLTTRSVSTNQATLYLDYMIQYRRELQRLFPDYACHPNHHMAMHLGEFLLMYGPVHGWWTFAIERMIGRLQRIMTNYKIGEYEVTIGRSWTRSANFYALFSTETCPETIRFCVGLFEKIIRFENRNTLVDAFSDGEEDDLPDVRETSDSGAKLLSSEVLRALREARPDTRFPTSATLKGRVTVHGVTYSVKSVHEGNSGVMLRQSDTPFSIVEILQFSDGWTGSEKLWFVAKRHRRADVNTDPYTRYPHIRAKLWSTVLEETIEVFPFSHVGTHFAKCAVVWEGKELAVVVSLSKSYVAW